VKLPAVTATSLLALDTVQWVGQRMWIGWWMVFYIRCAFLSLLNLIDVAYVIMP